MRLPLVELTGGDVAQLPHGLQHPLADLLIDVGTVVQNPVYGSPGDPRQLCHHLNCRSGSHQKHPPSVCLHN